MGKKRKNSSKQSGQTAELDLEVLRSEQLRVRLLALFFCFAFMVALITESFFAPVYISANGKQLNLGQFMVFFAIAALVETAVFFLIGRARKRKQMPPVIVRYFNALLETSFPTVGLFIILTDSQDPVMLGAPPVFAYPLFILLSVLRLNFSLPFFTGLVAALEYLALTLFTINWFQQSTNLEIPASQEFYISRAVLFLLTGIIAGLIGRRLRHHIEATLFNKEERQNILRIFGSHVSTQVVDTLLAGDSENEMVTEKDVSVLFLDIRDFTSFAEKKGPAQTFAFLNTVFENMIDIVRDHNGIINKFLGDGFIAVFGAPVASDTHRRDALHCSLAIWRDTRSRIEQKKLPQIRLGMGLHCGKVMTGNLGSQFRKEYTLIGDVVNVAARIEQLNKPLKSEILVSADILHDNPPPADVMQKFHGEMSVKGRDKKIKVVELLISSGKS